MSEWGDFYERAPGSKLTQMEVQGGIVVTVDRIEKTQVEVGQRGNKRMAARGLVHFRENAVRPWLMPQQEALLLAAIGLAPSTLPGVQLLLDRDEDRRWGADTVGGTAIVAVSTMPRGGDVRWRNGNRSMQRTLRAFPVQRSPIEAAADHIGVAPGILVDWLRTKVVDFDTIPDAKKVFYARRAADKNADEVRAFQQFASAASDARTAAVAGREPGEE